MCLTTQAMRGFAHIPGYYLDRAGVCDQSLIRAARETKMVYFQSFVGAMVATAFIVIIARFLLSFFLAEPTNYTPSICVGAGFLLGHYLANGSTDNLDIVVAIAKFLGSAVCLMVLAAGFRYQATRANVA